MGTCSHHQGSGDSCFPQQLLKPSVSLFGIRGLLQTQALSFEADLFQTWECMFSVVSAMASVHLMSITMPCCPSILLSILSLSHHAGGRNIGRGRRRQAVGCFWNHIAITQTTILSAIQRAAERSTMEFLGALVVEMPNKCPIATVGGFSMVQRATIENLLATARPLTLL